jgi:hypothetical protein
MDNLDINILAILIHGLIALIAGLMKEINKVSKAKISVIRMVSNGTVSAFVGITVFFLLKSLEASPYLTAFCTSVAGWAGGPLMDFFAELAKKLLKDKAGIADKSEETKDTEK